MLVSPKEKVPVGMYEIPEVNVTPDQLIKSFEELKKFAGKKERKVIDRQIQILEERSSSL